jgi:DNA (cytosine-5)-methyltransferase 1
MKILNLYCSFGGNRYKWDEVAKEAGIEIEITAVELDQEVAKLYQERFPNDIVIIADAHQYLLDNYKEFDFIWSSPPCPSHSRARFWGFGVNGKNPIYPDMSLYQEIIFLQHHCKTKFVVENGFNNISEGTAFYNKIKQDGTLSDYNKVVTEAFNLWDSLRNR